MGLQLAHQPLVGDTLAERHDDGGRRDAGNGVAYLAEMLDVLMQCFAVALTYGEEIAAHPRSHERPGEVGDELLAQLPLGPNGSRREVHCGGTTQKTGPGCTDLRC